MNNSHISLSLELAIVNDLPYKNQISITVIKSRIISRGQEVCDISNSHTNVAKIYLGVKTYLWVSSFRSLTELQFLHLLGHIFLLI